MFNFNMTGTFILGSLFIISFVTTMIFSLNKKYRYKQIKSGINEKPIENIKQIIKNDIQLKIKNNYFKPNLLDNQIYLDKDNFLSNEVYSQVNSIFIAFRFKIQQNKMIKWRVVYVINIINFLSLLSLMPLLILGKWFYLIIPSSFIVINFIIELVISQKTINKAYRLSKEFITINESENVVYDSLKYLKSKKNIIIVKYLSLFINPFISIWNSFREWGSDG